MLKWKDGLRKAHLPFFLLPRLSPTMDPDFLGGNAGFLLQLLEEIPRRYDRPSRQHLKSILERIEQWSIPKARVEVLLRNVGEKNVDIEVLKKAQALVSARVGENLESEIVRRKAEVDKWEIALLKGIVFKVMKENQVLQKEAQELMHEIGQKNVEMEAIRRTAQELRNEVGEKNRDIEALRRKAAAEIEARVAFSMAAMTSKTEENELEIDSLQKQLAEKSRAIEDLEKRRRATKSTFASAMKGMKRKAKEDELKIESLQKQLAAKDLLMEKDLEDVRAVKRSKLKGGAEDFIRVKVARDEEEAAKRHSKDDGGKDNLIVNDGSNHVKVGVGAQFGEEEAEGDEISLPVLVPDPCSEEEEICSPVLAPDPEEGIVVPDAEFHEFDIARREMDILPGHIWAIYDDQHGMPRFYARISKVTTKPFNAHMHWLDNCSATDEEIAWTERTGLSITCGDFKMGRSDVLHNIHTFSYFVMDKVGRGRVKIYPKKGQVWAVYRDPEQEVRPAGPEQEIRSAGPELEIRTTGGPEFDGEGSIYEYDMVEILSQFCDKEGLRTGKLVKVRGFNTVFCRQEGIESCRSFKREELVKFSHNIPTHRIEDSQTEACGIPRGSLELDPAATPDCSNQLCSQDYIRD